MFKTGDRLLYRGATDPTFTSGIGLPVNTPMTLVSPRNTGNGKRAWNITTQSHGGGWVYEHELMPTDKKQKITFYKRMVSDLEESLAAAKLQLTTAEKYDSPEEAIADILITKMNDKTLTAKEKTKAVAEAIKSMNSGAFGTLSH